jgi:hypothetical protein
MLWFERQIVHQLISESLSGAPRERIEAHVDGALRVMPEHLRAGVLAESIVLGAPSYLRQALGRFNPRRLDRDIERWGASRIDVIRQYARLFQSLVLFAEYELEVEPSR